MSSSTERQFLTQLFHQLDGETSFPQPNPEELNVDALLLAQAVEEETNELEKHENDNLSALLNRGINSDEVIAKFMPKLVGYRVIHHLYELRRGRYVRWIRDDLGPTPVWKLTRGAFLMDINYTNLGVYLVLKNSNQCFFRIKFDDVLLFQQYPLVSMEMISE